MNDQTAGVQHRGSAISDGRLAIMLLRSQHVGWRGLRSLLETRGSVRVVADVMLQLPAVAKAMKLQPDVILMAGDDETVPAIQLVGMLREYAPNSAIVVLGAVQDRGTLLGLARAGIAGYLVWGELDEHKVWSALHAVEAGLCIAAVDIVSELFAPVDVIGRAWRKKLELTEADCAILRRLASGEREREIAVAECLSVRTVERRIATLEKRFGSRALYELRLQARDLGFGVDLLT